MSGTVRYVGKVPSRIVYPERFTETQWSFRNRQAHDSSHGELENIDKLIAKSYVVRDETEERNEHGAKEVAYEFEKRIGDIKRWIEELEKKDYEVGEVTDQVNVVTGRVEKMIGSLRPIVQRDMLVLKERERRPGTELVNDEPQRNVLKELQLLEDVRLDAEKKLKQGNENLRLLRKFRYEMNLEIECKKQALQLDTHAMRLNEHSEGVRQVQDVGIRSHVPNELEWDRLTTRYVQEADSLIGKSVKYRLETESFMRLSGELMDAQVCNTNAAFEKRLWETRHAKEKLEQEHAIVTAKIREMEQVLEHLKKSYVEKQSSLELEKTRLAVRDGRPNLECVNDSVQKLLRRHVADLNLCMEEIRAQIQNTKLAFLRAQSHQVAIEEGINAKLQSIAIDETCVLPIRKQISVHYA